MLATSLQNKNAIRGVVCVLIQGIEPPTLGLPSTSTLSDNLPQSLLPGLPKSSLPLFQKLFSHYCPTRAPGDRIKLHSVVQALLNAPIPAGEKQKRDQSRQKANSAFKSGGASGGEAAVAPDPAQYLLDPESFSENGYIVPSYGFDIAERRIRDPKGKSPAKLDRVTVRPFEEWQRDDGCIETPQLEHEDADADRPLLRILGIDCEMVRYKAGARCSLDPGHREADLVHVPCTLVVRDDGWFRSLPHLGRGRQRKVHLQYARQADKYRHGLCDRLFWHHRRAPCAGYNAVRGRAETVERADRLRHCACRALTQLRSGGSEGGLDPLRR